MATSRLDKLQTYLPTGTWVMYTALQTWAFSLSPGVSPVSANSNCNIHQRIALIIVLCLSSSFAFLSSFVKQFVYDSDGVHVLHPAPNLFIVAQKFRDPITRVKFPCMTKEKRYCWPLIDDIGLKYDESGTRLKVLVFKPGVEILVGRKMWFKRVWHSWFNLEEKVSAAPQLIISPSSKQPSLSENITKPEGGIVTCDIDDVVATASELEPLWTHTIIGSLGSKAYLDLSPSVWPHAFVSVLAFFSLALFSTQVTGCVYPSIPDYLPPTVQTGMLTLLSLIAALFIRDDAVSLGQRMPRPAPISSDGAGEEVPVYLREVFEKLVLVSRQDDV